jgi:hypothetical protein
MYRNGLSLDLTDDRKLATWNFECEENLQDGFMKL